MNLKRTLDFDDNKLNPAKQSSDPEVMIRRYKPEIEKLSEQVFLRTQQILVSEQPPYLYANPMVTVTCEKPTQQFFSIVRKHQSEWCKQSRTIFGRGPMRKVSSWNLGGTEPEMSRKHRKFIRYMTRGFCFTGILFIQGEPVPNHEWKNIEKQGCSLS